ncbi:DUF5686 family protein [Rhodothermus profundi]|uniref:Surface antigen n=1 Tax=Rhodothermus profundi TaxID=633813 RepID=A0A1M6URX9_9BACT|nr:DUF5686 family protein [Rhodothermus profundi]SHK72002.1 Surface antigen [Rhodothermus profundi]
MWLLVALALLLASPSDSTRRNEIVPGLHLSTSRCEALWELDCRRPRPLAAFAGDFPHRWPFRETALYRSLPGLRYNRVEGLVLGLGTEPLEWTEYDRVRLLGQLAYAFALRRWRYEVGAETVLNPARHEAFYLKLGGGYYRTTRTDDLWKTTPLENTLAAFFFGNDFYALYYETEGWQLYAVQRLTRYAQLGLGFRAEAHRALSQKTRWALFARQAADFNLPAREGRRHALVLTLDAGRILAYKDLPTGWALRLQAELGRHLGGELLYNRYVADGRLYLPMGHYSRLNLRVRGGWADATAPIQQQFFLGGIGSVRGYAQNAYVGTRMLLGNAELVIQGVSLVPGEVIEDLVFLAFFDAGWVNAFGTDTFRSRDMLSAAGIGLGLDEGRSIRLELAWPLRDLGQGYRPSLWFRISPAF